MLPHADVYYVSYDPTCVKAGHKFGYCRDCGQEADHEIIPATGHTEETVAGTAPTCTTTGLTDGTKCSVCGVVLVAREEIAMIPHTSEVVPGYEPTCKDTGLTDGTKCSVCGVVLVAREEIPVSNAHVYEEVIDPSTCKVQGEKYNKCTVCGVEDTHIALPVNPDEHVDLDDMTVTVNATCTVDGKAIFFCKDCNVYVTITGYDPAYPETSILQAPGHTEVVDSEATATCTTPGLTEGKHCSVCGTVTVAQTVVDALGHDIVILPAVAPTCTATGLTQGQYCSRCSEEKIDQTVVAALGHTEAIDAAVAPTCTDTGLTEGKHCSVCGEVLVAQTEVAALGHTEVVDAAVAPDCVNTGLTAGSHCSVCGEVIVAQDTVAALGHTEVVDAAVAATCTTTGLTEGKHCSVCSEVLVAQTVVGIDTVDRDVVENHGGNAVLVEEYRPGDCLLNGYYQYKCTACKDEKGDDYIFQVIIKAPGHTKVVDAAVAPTCTATGLTEGSHCSVCFEVLVAQETVAALGHTEVVDAAVAATCTTTGLTEGKHCSVCGTVLTAQTVVDALGHTAVVDAAVAPTCTETGLTEGSHCSVCDTVLVAQTEVAALGHTEVVDVAVAPDCVNTGLTEGKHCSVCNTVLVAQDTVDALGHTEVVDAAKAPDCVNTGLTEGKHCSVCSEVLVAQTVVDALGHTEVIDAAVAATCTTTGLTEGKHCSVCDAVLTAQTVVDALGHTVVVDAAVAPTCTETGLTEGSHCSVCNEVLVAQTTVPAKGHDDEKVDSSVLSCEKINYNHMVCKVCGNEYVDDYMDPTGHHYVAAPAESKAPTCTEGGYNIERCDNPNCDVVGGDTVKTDLDSLGGHRNIAGDLITSACNIELADRVCVKCGTIDVVHHYESVSMPATCNTYAYSADICSVCFDVKNFVELGEVYADHDFQLSVGHVDSVAPTYTSAGLDIYVCSVCALEDPREVAPLVGVDFTYEVENGVKAGYDITNSGLIAIKIKLSAITVNAWGLSLNVKYDNSVVSFDSIEFADTNMFNGSADGYGVDATGTLSILANAANTEDSKMTNVVIDGDEIEFATVYFRVNANAQGKTASFTVVNSQIADKDGTVISTAHGTIADTTIVALGNVNGDAEIQLVDVTAIMSIITGDSTAEYNSAADIDKDGEITVADFMALQGYLLGKVTYEELVMSGIVVD